MHTTLKALIIRRFSEDAADLGLDRLQMCTDATSTRIGLKPLLPKVTDERSFFETNVFRDTWGFTLLFARGPLQFIP